MTQTATLSSINKGRNRQPDALDKAHMLQVFTIQVAGHWYGLPIESVRTVFRTNTITTVPMAPPAVAGLVNVRGEVLTAIHVTSYLGLKPAGEQLNYLLVGVEYHDEAYGLIIEKAGDILDIDEATRILIPASHKSATAQIPLPTYKVGDFLLPLLDMETMIKSITATRNTLSTSKHNLSA